MNVLICAEHRDGRPRRGSLELVSAARGAGGTVTAFVSGGGAQAAAEELARYCDAVFVAENIPADNREAMLTGLGAALEETGAPLVLFSCNRSGQTLAPRFAVRTGAAFLEDLSSLETENGTVRGRRLSFLSRVTETVETDAATVVASIKPNTFPAPDEAASAGEISALAVTPAENDLRVSAGASETAAAGAVSLAEADVVVAGGRGLGTEENFTLLVEPLAAELGAAIGSTRAVVDAGWRPFAEQVGQTGKTVAPGLYIALGISGAVQHLSGMNRSGVIVSINRDADAPLLKISDYAVIGDVSDVVPALVEAVRELKQEG